MSGSNGADHPKIVAAVNPQVEEICEQLPHFGDAWKKEIYGKPETEISIVMFTPPERLGPLVKPRFFSSLTLMTNRGPAQVGFEIPASTIHEAEGLWRGCAQNAIREAHNHMQESQRRVLLPSEVSQAPFQKKVIN